jgi:NADPH:quinone reductase-like Zn-dependent oxidoreductase
VAVGARVLVNPVISCGRCRDCLLGRDNMCAAFSVLGEHRKGCLAELVVVPAENLVPAPAGVDDSVLAALPTTYMTAWQMLTTRANLRPGEWLLLWAAGSGVGVAALQIAKLLGARVIATASSEAKLERARALGADACLLSSREDLHKFVRQCTDGRGADVVFEHVGAESWSRSILACARGGRIVTCGATTGFDARTDLRHVFFRQLSILGCTMARKGDLFDLVALVAEKRLAPVIDRVEPLSAVRAAAERLENRDAFGKIVLRP